MRGAIDGTPAGRDDDGMADVYPDFATLARHEREGLDWRRVVVIRNSPVAVVALHGGGIEAGTSELAHAIAGEEFSLYCFEGIKVRGNDALHVRSIAFDDRACLEVVERAERVVAVHGCGDDGARVFVGGRDGALRARVLAALGDAGFAACVDDTAHRGHDPRNVCNRTRRGAGVQLELTTSLRAQFFDGLRAPDRVRRTAEFTRFVDALRGALREGDTT